MCDDRSDIVPDTVELYPVLLPISGGIRVAHLFCGPVVQDRQSHFSQSGDQFLEIRLRNGKSVLPENAIVVNPQAGRKIETRPGFRTGRMHGKDTPDTLRLGLPPHGELLRKPLDKKRPTFRRTFNAGLIVPEMSEKRFAPCSIGEGKVKGTASAVIGMGFHREQPVFTVSFDCSPRSR